MLARFAAQVHEVRLALRAELLRRRERAVLRRLGEDVARTAASGEAFAPLLAEIVESERRCAAMADQRRASLDEDRSDLREVAAWARPLVVLRGLCSRIVLRHMESLERRALRPRLERLGGLAMEAVDSGGDLRRKEVLAVRSDLATVVAERDHRLAPFGGSALPAWTARAGRETASFGRAVLGQLRSHFLPRAPAVFGLAVGWWIANTYTDSHLRSVLRSVGIGRGGTRVVSSSTYEAMSFWLPLLAAALCAYLGDRLSEHYRRKA
jgi:hypothetical protein